MSSRIALAAAICLAGSTSATVFEAEDAGVWSGGARVINDYGACNNALMTQVCPGHAITLTTPEPNNYFRVDIVPGQLAAGAYSIYIRARSGRADGAAANLGVHLGTVGLAGDDVVDIPIRDTRFRWYAAQVFATSGQQSLYIADYSDPMLVIDKIAIEPSLMVPAVSVRFGPGGSTLGDWVADPQARSGYGLGLTRVVAGTYARWDIAPTALNSSALYSVRIRARTLDGSARRWNQLVYVDNDPQFGLVETTAFVDVSGISYRWYDLGTFVPGALRQNVTVSDYSDPGIVIDQIALAPATPSDFVPQGIFEGKPIDARPARVVSDEEFVADIYQLLLWRDRAASEPTLLPEVRTLGRAWVFDHIWNMVDLNAQPFGRSPHGYVARLNQRILGNQAAPAALIDTEAASIGSTESMWFDLYETYVEFRDAFPVVTNPDDRFIEDAYRLLWDDPHAPGQSRIAQDWEVDEVLKNIPLWSRPLYYSFFQPSSWFADPSKKEAFARRLFDEILHRPPTLIELNLTCQELGGSPADWVAMYERFIRSREYIAENVGRMTYQYGEGITPSKPTLRDLIEGRARFQNYNSTAWAAAEARTVRFSDGAVGERSPLLEPSAVGVDLQVHYTSFSVHRENGRYYAVARNKLNFPPAPDGGEQVAMTISILESVDGETFSPVDSAQGLKRDIFDAGPPGSGPTYYDPQVVLDPGVFPSRYYLFMECDGLPGLDRAGPSACVSASSRLRSHKGWTAPNYVIAMSDAKVSASTPRTLIDGATFHTAWATVDQSFDAGLTDAGDGWCVQTGNAETRTHSYARGQFLGPLPVNPPWGQASTYASVAKSTEVGVLQFNAHKPIFTGPWDGNLRNVLDWRREGDLFYSTYLGGNYFWSYGPPPDAPNVLSTLPNHCQNQPNSWHLATSVSASSAGPYRSVATPYIHPLRTEWAQLQYPSLAVVNGELALYLHDTADATIGRYVIWKSKLVWRSAP